MTDMIDYQKELERFTYIVSHDFQAPIRHVKQFGTLLFDEMEGRIKDEEKLYFQYMKDGIQKAEAMLSSLLAYSRLDTEADIFRPFDCNTIIKKISKTYDHSDRSCIKAAGLPKKIKGDAKQFEILFFQLIDNAFKFKQENTKPVVQIGCVEEEKIYKFCVKDNGMGISEEYWSHVFEIFKKTPETTDFEGTGCGLAMAQKIVLRHGGSIYIQSEKNTGTCVVFTISKNL